MEHEYGAESECNCCTIERPPKTGSCLEESKNGGRTEAIQTAKMTQYTEKKSGDLRRFDVTQTPVKDYRWLKYSQTVILIIIALARRLDLAIIEIKK